MKLKDIINQGMYRTIDDAMPGAPDPEIPEEQPVVDPVAAAPVIPDEVLAQIRQQAAEEAYQRLQAEQARYTPPPVVNEPLDPYSQAVQEFDERGLYPTEAQVTARAIAIAQQQTAETVRTQIMSQVAPHLARVNQRDVVNDIAGDLSPEAQQFVAKYAPSLDPNMPPEIREVFRLAAKQRDLEARTGRPEPTSLQPDIRVDVDSFNSYNADRAGFGLPPLSKAEYHQLSRENP